MRFVAILAMIMVSSVLSMPGLALNTKLYSLCEGNLSVDLGPGFEITQTAVDNSNNGTFNQNFRITNIETKGLAVIQITDLYDESLKALKPAAISELWVQGAVNSAIKDGGKPAGNWSINSSNGGNITVHVVSLFNTSMGYMADKVEIANWMVSKDTYAGLMSFFDKNVTIQIIKTLTVK